MPNIGVRQIVRAVGTSPAMATSGTSGHSSIRGSKPFTADAPPTTSAAAATYNVRDYQNPDEPLTNHGAIDQSKGKDNGKGEGKKGGATTVVCFSCGRAAPKLLRCSKCHHAHYCGSQVRPSSGVKDVA